VGSEKKLFNIVNNVIIFIPDNALLFTVLAAIVVAPFAAGEAYLTKACPVKSESHLTGAKRISPGLQAKMGMTTVKIKNYSLFKI